MDAIRSPWSLLLILLVFGFAPGFVLRLLVLCYPRADPRRRELIAELYVVKRLDRPLWVAEQLETALFEGLSARFRMRRGRRFRATSFGSGSVLLDIQETQELHDFMYNWSQRASRGFRHKFSTMKIYILLDVAGSPGLAAEICWFGKFTLGRGIVVGRSGVAHRSDCRRYSGDLPINPNNRDKCISDATRSGESKCGCPVIGSAQSTVDNSGISENSAGGDV